MISMNRLRNTVLLLILFFVFSCKEKAQKSNFSFTNDLVHETSPYLLQHAHNPVNWKAWNDEVLEEAEKSGKLILISIGYSSCHWCHVMEKETFEDEAIAKLMNDNFINIKVDREERPDIDQVYQTAAQLTGKNGGWPLNAIALPNGKPLYLGTYHTKKQWQEVLSSVHKSYTEDPTKAEEYANSLAAGIEETSLYEPSSEFEKLSTEALNSAVNQWKQTWDPEFGGTRGQQKFPAANGLSFLLDYAAVAEDAEALSHVKNTLDKMVDGGLNDHVGGGFFRYSTDPEWKVPHFEKMLYDNAQLIQLYSKAYKVFGTENYKEAVEQTTAFLEREMKNENGGYFAALDADSENEEGKFYIWTKDELQTILENDYDLFSTLYSIKEGRAWENDTYILYKSDVESFLKNHKLTAADLKQKRATWNQKLMLARQKRVRPNIDDKIITSWNALLINGFVEAYQAFGDESYLKKAISICDFIQTNSYSENALVHSFKKGSTRNEGFLEDYAFLAEASLNLYKSTLEPQYLNFSNDLMSQVQHHFSDAVSGLYKFNKDEGLISNPIKTDDGDVPSANSVIAHNLFQLGHINYNPEFTKKSKTMLTTLLPYVTDYSGSYTNWSKLLLNVSHPYYEIAVVGPNAPQMVKELQKNNIANTLIVGSAKESELPLFEDRYFDDNTYIFVCQDRVCKLPVTTVEQAIKQLEDF